MAELAPESRSTLDMFRRDSIATGIEFLVDNWFLSERDLGGRWKANLTPLNDTTQPAEGNIIVKHVREIDKRS